MKWKFNLVLVLVVSFIVYIIFYPVQFEFYEDTKAKKIVDYIILPIAGIVLIYDIYWNIKKREKKWKKYISDFSTIVGALALLYLLILRKFFSAFLIFINSIFGEVEIVDINGIIIEKNPPYEIMVDQNGKELILESKPKIIESYNVNEQFNMEMKKGILNLIYK